ncbi:efflux RND transporter periplasmic adaptor subunit [Aurantibacillus circumpalustris]|uniref:efflux RND transporter periplasmic adaptor subunit n=1 Tax=Aurantibacillus circumpalustris TaxID=3036359 RepID=UPI00295ACE5F|nr:efflux RND transporter periplasmic adaptor subunit [Aurantibacillus circumpalustris]
MKRIYWIIIIGILAVGAIVVVQVLKGNKPTEVYTEAAQIRSIVEVVSATGKIQPETELKISSDVSGEITEMLVKEGDQVKKGTLLCRIRPDLYVSAYDRVNASVNTTKANLKTAQAQLLQAKANLLNSETVYNRNKKLLEQNAISQQDFDALKAQYEGAKANVSALEAGVNASQFTIESSEASLKEANSNLEKTYIYSPVDATISKLSVEKGERVMGVNGLSGTEIMRLANLNEMEVSVEVNENDIIKVHKNDTAIIEVDAYMDKKFKGIVSEIANSSNATGISVDQVTNFVVKVRMLRESYGYLINERNLIPFRPGMSASVDIQTRRVNKVVSIPIQAVTTRNKDSLDSKMDGDERRRIEVKNEIEEKEAASLKKEVKIKEYVFVLENEQIKQVEVKTGIQDNDYIEIISGIKQKDVIICGPYSAVSKNLTEKTKVKVVKKEDLYKTDK